MSITSQRAQEFGIPPQGKDENTHTFRNRVANAIRAQGHIIEAHEAQSNKLYDDPDGDAMIGITGAVAQALQGKNYRGDQVANDIATGAIASAKKHDTSAMVLLTALLMMDN